VTLWGTVTGSAPLSDTMAPPVGAAPVNATVPVTGLPPTTVVALSDNDARTAACVTVSVGDVVLAPFSVTRIVAEPGATVVTVTPAVVAPGGTVTKA
jgi:hypothetical protein